MLSDGFLTWFDKKDLLPGDNWESKIEDAIDDSDSVLVFLSRNSCSKDGFFQKEVRTAMTRLERKPEGSRYIIPVLLEECDVPKNFKSFHFCRLWLPGEYDQLVRALRATPPKP